MQRWCFLHERSHPTTTHMTQPIRFVRFSQVYLKSRIVGHWTPCRSNCYHTNDIKVFPYVHTRCRLLPFGCGDAWLLVINHGVVFVGWYLRQCDCCARCTEGASLLGAHGSDQMKCIHKFINLMLLVLQREFCRRRRICLINTGDAIGRWRRVATAISGNRHVWGNGERRHCATHSAARGAPPAPPSQDKEG